MDFNEPGSEPTFTFEVSGVYFGISGVEAFPLDPRAEEVPVQYTPDEWTDLAGYLTSSCGGCRRLRLAAWAKSFVAGDQDRAVDVLRRMLRIFRDGFRHQPGTRKELQTPGETTCVSDPGHVGTMPGWMIEALRRPRLRVALRLAATCTMVLSMEAPSACAERGRPTAWLQVFLPGAGWLDYDPTSQISAGFDLIPVAAARHPGQGHSAGRPRGLVRRTDHPWHDGQRGRREDRRGSRSTNVIGLWPRSLRRPPSGPAVPALSPHDGLGDAAPTPSPSHRSSAHRRAARACRRRARVRRPSSALRASSQANQCGHQEPGCSSAFSSQVS